MKQAPIMSVSGIRGVYGESIDENFYTTIAYLQTKAAGGGKIVVGRDTRPSGASLAKAVFKGIRAAGGTPIDLGIAPTPTTCVAVAELNASAGVIISASHNPSQYNGYKMVHSSGRLYRGDECEQVYTAFRSSTVDPSIFACSDTPDQTVDGAAIHIKRILPHIDVKLIASKNISIAVDSINGAGAAVFPRLLKELNVQWSGVYNDMDGNFAHNPEPRPEFLGELASHLKNNKGLWGGFVFDPDADRLATMGEHGEEISEEMTLVFALDNILSRAKTNVATNLSTSMLIDDVAKKYGVKVYRTKIGEANVVEGMQQFDCKAGGEGNGGVIYPRISTARDGLAGMALILELMAKRDLTLSELAAQWPSYAIVKNKLPADKNPGELFDFLSKKFSSETIDRTDGLKIIRSTGWVHLRASNTEPIIRCYAEAVSADEAQKLADMITDALKS